MIDFDLLFSLVVVTDGGTVIRNGQLNVTSGDPQPPLPSLPIKRDSMGDIGWKVITKLKSCD